MFSKRIMFAGTLASMPWREASLAAANAGAEPTQSVSKRTSYVVVGTTGLRREGETGRSSKHRKTLALAAVDLRCRSSAAQQPAGTVTAST